MMSREEQRDRERLLVLRLYHSFYALEICHFHLAFHIISASNLACQRGRQRNLRQIADANN
jgi:hypothetical protein